MAGSRRFAAVWCSSGPAARIDFVLEGRVTQTIDGGSAHIKSDSSELDEMIEERAIRELPLNKRNFAQLVYLTPGVTPSQNGKNLSNASTFNPRAESNFNALGHHGNSNGWLVDDINNNEYTFNTVIVQPSIESVREFKVLTGVYSAEFACRAAGVHKTGSNAIHGTFDYCATMSDAKNYYQSSTQRLRPPQPVRRCVGGRVAAKRITGRIRRTFLPTTSGCAKPAA
jgi:hypothetical protein